MGLFKKQVPETEKDQQIKELYDSCVTLTNTNLALNNAIGQLWAEKKQIQDEYASMLGGLIIQNGGEITLPLDMIEASIGMNLRTRHHENEKAILLTLVEPPETATVELVQEEPNAKK